MDQQVAITMEQAQEEMNVFRRVFPDVRLITGDDIGKPFENGSAWLVDKSVTDRIASDALSGKKQISRLEFIGAQIYQIVAVYVETDGSPSVILMQKELSGDSTFSLNGHEELAAQFARNNTEIYIDALTGAYNRRYFEDRLKNSAVSAGVVMIDLDDFKMYNDTCGHDAGDAALRTTVEIIRRCIRATDILVRYGGDEFLLVMPGMTEERFSQQLRFMRRVIYKSEIPGFPGLHLSVSMGGVMAVKEPLASAITRADKNMYLAKNRKNAVVTEDTHPVSENSGRLNVLIVDDSELNREICRWHHERWDGGGYPDGLKGDEIPISAQIVSIADVYDALVSVRVYKKAFSHETAIQMILSGECGQFNPVLLECLTDIQYELRELCAQ